MRNHRHYELARRAHYHTSHVPEVRAEQFCKGFDEDIAKLESLGIEQYKIDKYEALTVAHMHAKSRCLSSMITGPANFPVRCAERANSVERARGEARIAYYNKIVAEAKREAYYETHPEARPIESSDENAVERLQEKVEVLKLKQSNMVAANKLIKKNDVEGLTVLLGAQIAKIFLEGGGWWGKGYAPFELTNNRAKIKATEDRIAQLSKTKERGTVEHKIAGIKIVENTELMRVQLFFEGKPSNEIITLLKRNGMKWAPSHKAWQRQLTSNARYAVNNMLPQIKRLLAA